MRRLYERHSVHVYRFARRLGVDQSTAEDLVSEVFLQVWRSAGAFEGRAQVSTWLLAITRYGALDTIRRRPLEPLDEIASATIEDDSDGPKAAIQKKQAASVLIKPYRIYRQLTATSLTSCTITRNRSMKSHGPQHPSRHRKDPDVLRAQAAGAGAGARRPRWASAARLKPKRHPVASVIMVWPAIEGQVTALAK